MTFFTESNEDALSVHVDQAAPGPLVGFLEAFDVSYQAQRRAAAQNGLATYMEQLDYQQSRALADLEERDSARATAPVPGERTLGLGVPDIYEDIARRANGEQANDQYTAQIEQYDQRVRDLRAANPDVQLMTSSEMFDQVREQAQFYDQREQSDRRTWGGAFGGFLGGTLASLAPDTDPINYYTLGVGGAGRTAVSRILAQTGGQGAVETLNQVTGVQEQRRLLGLSHGLQDATQRVAFTALGAGSLQAAGELVATGARRWFRDTPVDPAPPIPAEPDAPTAPPRGADLREEAMVALIEQDPRNALDAILGDTPLSGIKAGTSRARLDLADAARQLDSWDAPHPNFVRPKTDTAPFQAPGTTARVDTEAAVSNNRVYQQAREFDPRAFEQYDKLLERRNTYRRWIDELAEGRQEAISQALDGIEVRIGQLEQQRRTTPGKNAKARIRNQIREAEADREQLLRTSQTRESSEIAQVRSDLVRNDEKMRDIAPLLGRAYAHARGRWDSTDAELDAIWQGYVNGRAEPDLPPQQITYDEALQLTDQVPILREAAKVEPGRSITETAQRIAQVDRTTFEAALDNYRAELDQILNQADDNTLQVDGSDFAFDLDRDRIDVPVEGGEGSRSITIREMLEEHQRLEQELEAVSTCSLPNRSSPA